MRRTCLALLALATIAAPSALAENQIWTAAGAKAKPFQNDRIELTFDADFRFQPDGELDTTELRPGIGYKLDDTFKLSGGYLWANVRQDGPDRREHRLWQQLSYDMAEALGGDIAGRTRIEQRQRENWDDTGWRWRQEFSFSRPLEGTPLTLKLSTDVHFELNETDWGQDPGFSENRAQAVMEWETHSGIVWEFGYLNQFSPARNGEASETNHHLVIGLSKEF